MASSQLQGEADYFLHQARISSFNVGRKVAKSQSRTSKATTSKQQLPAWPHPKSFRPNPETLAAAGFFFAAPLDNNAGPDQAECFMCTRSLAGWEKDDDPHHEHARREANCPWAVAVCSIQQDKIQLDPLEWAFRSQDRLPTNRRLEKARLGTFGDRWPHDGVKGHLVTSKKMAKAGFVFTPTQASLDLATCLYCDTVLDGWEPKDNPTAEHKSRSPTCPMFTAEVTVEEEEEDEEEVKPIKTIAKTTRSKKSSAVTPHTAASESKPPPAPNRVKRSTKGAKPKGNPIPEEDNEADVPAESQSQTLSKSTKASKARSTKLKPKVVEEVVTEDATEEEAPAPSQSRTGSSRSASTRHASTNQRKLVAPDPVANQEPPAKPSRKKLAAAPPSDVEPPVSHPKRTAPTRSKKQPARVVEAEEDLGAPPTPPPKDAITKGKRVEAPPPAEEDDEDITISQLPQDEPKPAMKKAAKSKTKEPKESSKRVKELTAKVREESPTEDMDITEVDIALGGSAAVPESEVESAAGETDSAMEMDEQDGPQPHGEPAMAAPPKSATPVKAVVGVSQPLPTTPPAVETPRPAKKATPTRPQVLKAVVSTQGLDAFTAEERKMTLERYIQFRMEIECENIRSEGQEEIDRFCEEAKRTRAVIEKL